MFAKQLMQVKQMTPERVLSVVSLYPTPLALITALQAQRLQAFLKIRLKLIYAPSADDAERERMLNEQTTTFEEKARVDKMLSKHVARLYTWPVLK